MDPDMTLTNLLNELACDDPDPVEVKEHLGELLTWLANGGFLPKVCRVEIDEADGEALVHLTKSFIVGDAARDYRRTVRP